MKFGNNPVCRFGKWIGFGFLVFVTMVGRVALAQSAAETLVLFDPAAFETPESIVFDKNDNAYISMAYTGEIRKIEPDLTQSTVAFLPTGAPCAEPRYTIILGLAIDTHEELYVAVSACDAANHGIWKVDKESGAATLLANVDHDVVLNGIDVYKDYIYAADTFGGRVWRVPIDGGTAELWAVDPLLERPPGSPFPGPNGIRVHKQEVYVAVSATADIVSIPFEPDYSAGQPYVYATIPGGQGCDEFVFDVNDNIYCTTDPFKTVIRVDTDGISEVLLTEADGLDGPTSVVFGRKGTNKKNLYITNAAFPEFGGIRPSLMRLPLDLPGVP